MGKNKNENWCDNPKIVDTLLFVFPPLGMYALYKTRSSRPYVNKLLYGILGFISFLMLLIYLTQ